MGHVGAWLAPSQTSITSLRKLGQPIFSTSHGKFSNKTCGHLLLFLCPDTHRIFHCQPLIDRMLRFGRSPRPRTTPTSSSSIPTARGFLDIPSKISRKSRSPSPSPLPQGPTTQVGSYSTPITSPPATAGTGALLDKVILTLRVLEKASGAIPIAKDAIQAAIGTTLLLAEAIKVFKYPLDSAP